MKILELCTSNGLGGLELYFLACTHRFIEMQHECVPVVLRNSPLDKKFQKTIRTPIILKNNSRYLPLLNAYRLARFIDSNNIELIHMHWAKDLMLAVLTKLFSKRKPRLVYTRHMEIYGDKHDQYHRFVYKNVDLMLTGTIRMSEQAKTSLPMPSERIRALHLGIPDYSGNRQQDRDNFRSKNGIPLQAFLIGLVGRIEPGKRQHILINALEMVADKHPEIFGVIVGAQHDKKYFEKLTRQVNEGILKDRVLFIGFSDQPRKAMASFDVAVLTTSCETFGLVLIEAMSTGTAVIGTRACGVKEIIDEEKNGLMFQPDDAKDLASKILMLYQDSTLRKKLGDSGKAKIKESFTEEIHWKKLVAYIENLIN